ncbi:MAG TPA: adenylate/guanylate cyclase domain-containing protein, partial [Dokdonella sp.]|nr:adenylate/guanylate cyclase domain-containing protein [Dokdonella sp.]
MTVSTSPASGVDIAANSLLRTLLLCDLVDSTALVERLGDREAAELIRKHDRLARTLADRHGGQEIDKTDGFMMMFERPIQAVAFALDYQRGLRQLNAAEKSTLAARVGIHVGDVVVWDNSSEDIAKGAKPVEVEGLVKPVTSRLMNLALPGQILLSNIAYDLAHRAQGELGEALEKVRWRTHGRYRFRGVPDPVAVFEVGEEGLAPLKA